MCIGITNLYNQKTGKIISIKLFITEKEYNEVEYIVPQTSYQNGEVIYQVSYRYDANGNLKEEDINGKKNTYSYNEYDELIESKLQLQQ